MMGHLLPAPRRDRARHKPAHPAQVLPERPHYTAAAGVRAGSQSKELTNYLYVVNSLSTPISCTSALDKKASNEWSRGMLGVGRPATPMPLDAGQEDGDHG